MIQVIWPKDYIQEWMQKLFELFPIEFHAIVIFKCLICFLFASRSKLIP